MSSAEVERREQEEADHIDDDDAVELSPRQIAALEKLQELGAGPRESEDEPYHQDAQIRAFQLVFEGRLGGPGRGQGRKRQKRATEIVSAKLRRDADKLYRKLSDAIDSDNERISLDALKTAFDLDNKEAALQLKEDRFEADLEDQSKEQLIASLFRLLGNPQVEAQIGEVIDLPESAISEVISGDEERFVTDERPIPDTRRIAAAVAADSSEDGVDVRASSSNGRARPSRPRSSGANPFTEAARRRAANG